MGEREVMKKLTFEIRSPAHQQNAIHAVQQILPDPTKPIVVTIQERNRSLDQNRKLWACLGDVSRQVEWHGRWLDAESWKCVFTAALKQQDVVPNLAGNGFVVIGQSTSRMRVGVVRRSETGSGVESEMGRSGCMTIKSNTPAHDKDCWQTPLWLFDALDIEFGFWLDSAASDKNALCAHWLTEADDALNSEWVSHGAIWNNPPYSNIRPWVEKAAEQCIQQRQTVVMLVPEDMSVGWFSKALESVDEVRIITDGRINFIEPSTGLEKKGNSKGSMLLIWRPFISPRRMFTTVSKAALMAIGQGVRRAA